MQKAELSWKDVENRAELVARQITERFVDLEQVHIYPVPRGGIFAAQAIQLALMRLKFPLFVSLVSHPTEADLYIDDIVDSGTTRTRFLDKPFYSLVDKQKEELGWVVFPWESMCQETAPEDAVIRLLQYIGEDPLRDGLRDTPRRVCKALREMTIGYSQDVGTILTRTFEVPFDQLIILKGIRFTSLCEHHLMTFNGEIHVGYLPGESVLGISKLVRTVEVFSKRLQVQERLVQQVADSVMQYSGARGVGVVAKARHSCMGCRGVHQPDADMVTSVVRGDLLENASLKAEFLRLCEI